MQKVMMGVGILIVIAIIVIYNKKPEIVIESTNEIVQNQPTENTDDIYIKKKGAVTFLEEPPEGVETIEEKMARARFENFSKKEQLYQLGKSRISMIEDQSFVDVENNKIIASLDRQIDRPIGIKEFDEKFEVFKNFYQKEYKDVPEFFDEEPPETPIVNYVFIQYLKPKELKLMVSDLSLQRIKSFEFFTLENGDKENLKKITINSCKHECYSEETYYERDYPDIKRNYRPDINCSDTHCWGSVYFNPIYENTIEKWNSFYINKDGILFLYNYLDETLKPYTKTKVKYSKEREHGAYF